MKTHVSHSARERRSDQLRNWFYIESFSETSWDRAQVFHFWQELIYFCSFLHFVSNVRMISDVRISNELRVRSKKNPLTMRMNIDNKFEVRNLNVFIISRMIGWVYFRMYNLLFVTFYCDLFINYDICSKENYYWKIAHNLYHNISYYVPSRFGGWYLHYISIH